MKITYPIQTVACAAMLLHAGSASAHTGLHGLAGFAGGAVHPFLGLDHLLAMTGVGLWAALGERRGRILLPLAFMAGMILGGGSGATGFSLPYLEPGIALSVALLGLLILAGRHASPFAAGALVLLFGGLHGHAHGLEMAAQADFAGYALGFSLSTGLLHLAGLGLGLSLAGLPRLYRACGGMLGAVGLVLLTQSL